MKAYEVSVKGTPWQRTIFAASAGKAKYSYLLDVRDAWPGVSFESLRCRSLGDIPVPLTRTQQAQRECGQFNALYPVGTEMQYWSGVYEGPPTGIATICHPATVMCEHAVIWLAGVSSCHSLTHVEPAKRSA